MERKQHVLLLQASLCTIKSRMLDRSATTVRHDEMAVCPAALVDSSESFRARSAVAQATFRPDHNPNRWIRGHREH